MQYVWPLGQPSNSSSLDITQKENTVSGNLHTALMGLILNNKENFVSTKNKILPYVSLYDLGLIILSYSPSNTP